MGDGSSPIMPPALLVAPPCVRCETTLASATGEGSLLTSSARMRRYLDHASTPAVRGARVTLLLGAIALVSVVDLILTLKFVTTVGMIEANPIARWVMRSGDAWTLTIFKLSLTLICLGTIFWLRRIRTAELAAWFCFAVMLALSMKWSMFLTQVQTEYTADWNYLQQSGHPSFVMMTVE